LKGNERLLAAKLGERGHGTTEGEPTAAPASQSGAAPLGNQCVPKLLTKVLDKFVPDSALQSAVTYPCITGIVPDITATNQLMADIEAITGSRYAVARTRAKPIGFCIVHRCKRAMATSGRKSCTHSARGCNCPASITFRLSSDYASSLGYSTGKPIAMEAGATTAAAKCLGQEVETDVEHAAGGDGMAVEGSNKIAASAAEADSTLV
jgi:hypothetical protein